MKNSAKIRILISLSFFLLLLPLTSCQDNGTKWRIGVAQCSDDEWRRQMNEEIRREALFHDNVEVEIRSADDSNQRQIADIDYFINHGFDLIIVAPNEVDALTPAVRKAYSKGIPVIIFDRAVNDSSYTTYIELDNLGVGRNAALYTSGVINHTGGEVMEITGLPGSSPAEERHKGFMQVIDSLGSIHLAGSFHGDWKGKEAAQITDSVLRSNQNIKLIYAHNDVMAISAAKAARKLGRDDIVILGTDGAPELGIKAVADSVIDATFIYPTVGDRVISAAIEILEGKQHPKVEHIPSEAFIDRSNAAFHIRQNEVMKSKTDRIEQLNDKYTIIKNHNAQQNIFLIACAVAVILLIAGVVGLLFFIRQKNILINQKNTLLSQKNQLQEELMEKNAQLTAWGEKQTELYNRLEEATHEKLVFFTNVSHDLLTPLLLIAEPIDRLSAEKDISPDGRKLLLMMRRNVESLKKMIEQILDFRRYQNGKASLRLTETDPCSLVEQWGQALASLAARKDIKFSVMVRGKEYTMAVDEEKLQRVFFNLVTNAFKYTPPKGSVTVDCALDQFSFYLSVTDNGRGMDKEELDKIFERYYRINGSGANGVGIGLALSKAFVELMGGTITVESRKGDGAAFLVTIPVRHIAPSETEEVTTDSPLLSLPEVEEAEVVIPTDEPPVAGDSEKPLMLIIDDNEDIRSLVKVVCGEEYDVIDAADGKEGIRRAVKYVPDIIICDIMMPGIDGLETTRRLKEERATSHIPVLILTASRLDEQRVKSYDSGADGYLSKPFTEEMLLARCRSLIQNRRRIYDLFDTSSPSPLNLEKAKETKEKPTNSLDNDFYNDFLAFVQEKISDEKLSVKDIASRLGIGPAQLSRKIKALTGSTPVDIIREIRLREGRKLLITTDRSVADISYFLGFASPQYFARCFREKYGLSPTDLRASIK